MPKLDMHDTVVEAMMKMSEGNPGAIQCLAELIEANNIVDPDAPFPGMSAITRLDMLKIYGSSIYVLWSDKCGKDLRKMIMLLRASELGLIPNSKIQSMAADQMRRDALTEEEFSELDIKVCASLPNFLKSSIIG